MSFGPPCPVGKRSSSSRQDRPPGRRAVALKWEDIDSGPVLRLDDTAPGAPVQVLAEEMTREYARSPRGERVQGAVPHDAGTVTTMIGALDTKGVRAMMTIEGATDTEVFATFLERILVRKLKPGDVVVLDHVAANRTAEVRRLIWAAGARVLYPPPYSTGLNPIELCWSKLKALLRDFGTRPRCPR